MYRMGNKIKPEIYQRWVVTPGAQRLLSLEAGWLTDAIQSLHGIHLAYAGIDEKPRFLKRSRCHHQFCIGLPWQATSASRPQVISHDYSWPLMDESVDVVVLQHALDMSRRPHQTIREACRVLVPNGYLIVAGFNPYSVWGGMRLVNALSVRLPWVANPVAPGRLQDWLTLLDLRVEYIQHACHLWPIKLGSDRLSRRVDRLLVNRNRVPGNGYVLVARKTVAGITPIRQRRWSLAPTGFPAAAPATRDPINI